MHAHTPQSIPFAKPRDLDSLLNSLYHPLYSYLKVLEWPRCATQLQLPEVGCAKLRGLAQWLFTDCLVFQQLVSTKT